MYTIDDVHHYNDLLLAEVDRICKKHDIAYYMDSGTLIGAVRHNGNIPWDDDVDITMKRADYEKFIDVRQESLLTDMSSCSLKIMVRIISLILFRMWLLLRVQLSRIMMR